MKRFNYQKGKNGEKEAKDYLVEKGYKILEVNYRNQVGEIDIVAAEGNTLVFVEVKMKTDDKYGLPEEMITQHKLRQVRRVAEIYLLFNPKIKTEYPKQRIDAVCIVDDQIRHYINVGL